MFLSFELSGYKYTLQYKNEYEWAGSSEWCIYTCERAHRGQKKEPVQHKTENLPPNLRLV